ncbi:electron transfer flavoprotein subunit alpha/FixB family protein [Ectothiorhodospira lacustris]|uniref:electron transfer flavoprotein subunit alpha/FixB family protein n=1 Tax=Ectothiorhodospira lacustris TaxID=2899127 RepID=UPI001EE89DC9|nr:FAD-binding protein [Ectothiorhodospira lacustris]MCG5501126.1 FAD-binding protein [Ectothiorhodospira lacustris]MCG5511232.1 FAD-binding protein [Ectothiorhodospira lacustris]MCG5522952.1 FAD-binding protein [Ectothiorhodospira lacustris]
MTVLVVAEHDHKILSDAGRRAVAAATALGEDIRVLVAGHHCRAVAEAAARLQGVTQVLLCDDPLYEHQLAEPLAVLIAALAADHQAVVAAATSHGKDVMPRVAGLLDVGQVSDITAIESPTVFQRPIYAGNVMARVCCEERIRVLTIRTTAFAPAAEGGQAEITTIAAGPDPGVSRFVEDAMTRSERPELGAARVVISGGRGVGSAEGFGLLEAVADELGAAIGASRAAVDAGFVPNDYQVGQTGKIVAPELYIAVGISGAIQHWAGMKDSKVVVAINKDEECPMVQTADYALVGDLLEILPSLRDGLRQMKA